MKKIILICLLLNSVALSGCGQTGPLYLATSEQHSDQQPAAKD